MKARILLVIAVGAVGTFSLAITSAPPSTAACGGSATLLEASASCPSAPDGALPVGMSDTRSYVFQPVCGVRVSGVCGSPLRCTTPDGRPGVLHAVTIDGEDGGRWCISEAEANDAGVITPGQVLRAMRNLDWPESALVIQPPDGLTLVNFDTNFYTTSTQPVTRQVTLLGQQITIEATPAEYQWQFGDGQSLASTKPGAAYPALTITHNYERKGTYSPQLDTVYSGRYRVGSGPWQDIPGTHTVAGTPEQLRAIEAQPKLVGY